MQKFLGLAQKELLVKGQFDFILQDELTCRTMSSKLLCYILHVVCIMLVTSVKDVSKISQKFPEQLFRRTNPYLKTYSFTGVHRRREVGVISPSSLPPQNESLKGPP